MIWTISLPSTRNHCKEFVVLLKFCWSFVEVLLKFCWSFVEVLLKFCWSFVEVLLKFSYFCSLNHFSGFHNAKLQQNFNKTTIFSVEFWLKFQQNFNNQSWSFVEISAKLQQNYNVHSWSFLEISTKLQQNFNTTYPVFYILLHFWFLVYGKPPNVLIIQLFQSKPLGQMSSHQHLNHQRALLSAWRAQHKACLCNLLWKIGWLANNRAPTPSKIHGNYDSPPSPQSPCSALLIFKSCK